ncbi:hypothetical protein MC885_008825 [Smutsia gigantea]|nr:hypothetical protein MC885_008825 [Smutsia gigantea]
MPRRFQLPALAHLAPHVEAVAGLGLDDAHDPRAAANPAAVTGAAKPRPPTAAATSVPASTPSPRELALLRHRATPRARARSADRGTRAGHRAAEGHIPAKSLGDKEAERKTQEQSTSTKRQHVLAALTKEGDE